MTSIPLASKTSRTSQDKLARYVPALKVCPFTPEFREFLREINCGSLKIDTEMMFGRGKHSSFYEEFCEPNFECSMMENIPNHDLYEVSFKTTCSISDDGFEVFMKEELGKNKNVSLVPLDQVERMFYNAMRLALVLYFGIPYCGIFSFKFTPEQASLRGEIISRCFEKLLLEPPISEVVAGSNMIFKKRVESDGSLEFYLTDSQYNY